MPRSFWKTPMMDVSPTSTLAQLLRTASPILTSPCTQAEVQVAPGLKSLATQPSILALYTAAHAEGRMSMRGVKLLRDTAEAVPVRTAKPMMAVRKEGNRMVGCLEAV